VSDALRTRALLGFVRETRWTVARARARATGHDVRFGRGVRLYGTPRFLTERRPGELIELGDGCEIDHGAILATYGGHIRLGRRCSVNAYSVLLGHGGLDVGDFVRIAPHAVIAAMNHVFADSDRPIAEQGLRREGIRIEDDVWVGAHATILDGCTIGRGAVVGAGAVVTRNVPPMSVVAGVPAAVVKRRGEAATT
jgi:acetyltransferase-like isoleucine patch superfamily enzyme